MTSKTDLSHPDSQEHPFRDPDYSATCLSHARALFQFAKEYPGRYDESIEDAHTNYPSTDFTDEIVWAAVWLFLATGRSSQL